MEREPRDSGAAEESPKSPEESGDQKGKDKDGSWKRFRRLLSYTGPYKFRLSIAFTSLVIAGVLGLIYPRFFGQVIDEAFTFKNVDGLNQTAGILVAIFAAQSVFVFFRHYLMSWVGERVVADLRVGLYQHLLKMSQAYFHRTRSGELLSRLADDVTRLQDVVGQDLSVALRSLLTLIGGIGILFWLNPVLTSVMLAVVPPLVIVSSVWGRIIRKISRAAQDQLSFASGELQEGLASVETVQAFTQESHEVLRYRDAIEKTFVLFAKRIRARSWFMSTASFLAFSTIAGIFWMGGKMVAEGEISAGQLAEFFFYTMAVAGAVAQLAGLAGRYNQAVGASGRIFEILDEVPEIDDPKNPKALAEARGELNFDGLTFAYGDRGGAPVIQDLNLTVAPGQVCALVGPSGSGKTTVGRLALRFWDPQAGAVRLDGVDLRDLRLADLRGCMALVSQDPVLFSGSILENIRYGCLSASDEEVFEAARAADVDEFVREFPEGYQTVVGERGIKLSGGQRQRISIARAILRDPRVLILDEATSALDSESEHAVQTALERLQQGRTTLVIAHRLSTIRDADQIVVFDHGKVVERGTHRDLVSKEGLYAQLVARQALETETLANKSLPGEEKYRAPAT